MLATAGFTRWQAVITVECGDFHRSDCMAENLSAEKLSEEDVQSRLVRQPGWEADGDQCIHRSFTFTDHITATGFVVRVAMVAEVMNHHPEMTILYNRVDITLSTHDAGGVTELDFTLAERIGGMIGLG